MQPVSFLEAIRFAQSRKIVLPDEFYKMDLKTRQLATTVSFLSSIEQVKQVIGLVNKAIASGTTFDQFKKDVAEKGIELSDHYLDLVFRQNVQSAYSAGRWQQQQRNKTKRPYLMYSAINDNRVRPSHLALDGIIRHIDDDFWQTHYPPWEFRCFLPDVRIEGASKGAIKRFYTGKVVDIFTKSGRKVSLTANHPILTSRGWVAAGNINNSDDLLGYNRPIKSTNVHRCSWEIDDNQAIPTAENLFKAFIIYTFAFCKTSTFKLDGNILTNDCQISIDILDSGLNFSIHPKGRERISQMILVDRNDRGYMPFESFCSSDFGFRDVDIMFAENARNIPNGCIEQGGEFLLTDILSFIFLNYSKFEFNIAISCSTPCSTTLALNSAGGLFDLLPFDRFGLASISQDNALFNELARNGLANDFGLFGYLIDTHSINVFRDPVVNIIKRSYSGHVYDFQSDSGLLSANGIIAHNCRCTVIALTEKQAEKRGITPDDKLPEIRNSDFATIPQTWGEMSELTRQKINESGIDPSLFDDTLRAVEAEWTASNKLTSLLAPMNKSSRELFDTIADTIIPLDPSIRPSAIKTLVDYVQGNDSALTAYLSQKPISLADDVLRRWLIADMGAIHAVAANTTATVSGSSTIAYVSKLEVGKTVTLDHPMLFAETSGEIVLQLENASGLGIDLNKLNAGQGVLFPIGLSFEIVKIETIKGQLIYTLRALVN